MSDDNIIRPDFSAKPTENSLSIRQRHRARGLPFCKHFKVSICASTMIVTCDECQVTVDPLHVLMQYAEGERKFEWAEKSLSDMRKRIAELKAEERRIKSRIYRAQKKSGQLGLNLKTSSTGEDRCEK